MATIGIVELIILAGILILGLALIAILARRSESGARYSAASLSNDVSRGDLDALERRVARLEARIETLYSELGVAQQQPSAPDESEEIAALLRTGGKIQAIKRYREMTNLGLREAKDAVEEIETRLRRSGRL